MTVSSLSSTVFFIMVDYLYEYAEVTFGDGPLGIQIISINGKDPPFTLHGFHRKRTENGDEIISRVESCGYLRIGGTWV